MKIGSMEKLFAAAVAFALAAPVSAQEEGQSAAGQTGTARSSEAGQNEEASGVDRSGGETGTAGRAARRRQTDRPIEGRVREEGTESGTRTANFPPQGDEGRDRQGQLGDGILVRWIAAGNEAEIKVNEFAQQHAQNEQVKQFAQRMIDEHTKLGEKLRQASPGVEDRQGAAEGSEDVQERTARRFPPGEDAEDQAQNANEDAATSDRAANDPRDRAENRPAGRMRRAGGALLSLHEEIKQQCAQSTIEALREKQGAEFDHAFMHQQIVEHMGMLDTLKVAEKHASEDLKPVLNEARQHTQQHLEEAKQIVAQLDEGQR